MFRLILQTQGRLEGFSVLSHLLSQKVPSSVLTISSVHWSLQVGCWWRVGRGWGECPFVDPKMVASDGIIWEHFMDPLSVQETQCFTGGGQWRVEGTTLTPAYQHFTGLCPLDT